MTDAPRDEGDMTADGERLPPTPEMVAWWRAYCGLDRPSKIAAAYRLRRHVELFLESLDFDKQTCITDTGPEFADMLGFALGEGVTRDDIEVSISEAEGRIPEEWIRDDPLWRATRAAYGVQHAS